MNQLRLPLSTWRITLLIKVKSCAPYLRSKLYIIFIRLLIKFSQIKNSKIYVYAHHCHKSASHKVSCGNITNRFLAVLPDKDQAHNKRDHCRCGHEMGEDGYFSESFFISCIVNPIYLQEPEYEHKFRKLNVNVQLEWIYLMLRVIDGIFRAWYLKVISTRKKSNWSISITSREQA